MWREFSFRGIFKWIDFLSELVSSYNTMKHRIIGIRPADVTAANANRLKKRFARNDSYLLAKRPSLKWSL